MIFIETLVNMSFDRCTQTDDDADDQPLLQKMYALLPEVCTFMLDDDSSNKTNFLEMMRLMKTDDFPVKNICGHLLFISFEMMF